METPTQKVKFYADTPRGDKNKLFTYPVKDYEHAFDLVAKFVQDKKFIVRAAFYINALNKSMRIDKFFDLTTYPRRTKKESY